MLEVCGTRDRLKQKSLSSALHTASPIFFSATALSLSFPFPLHISFLFF